MKDAELLALVAAERSASVGFDVSAELTKERETALNYYKGEMPDFRATEGRSSAVSTDVADAIETIKPDLIEIFTSEDVAAFMPRGEEDEEAAQQETDYINHVFFNENDGFLILHNMIDDALKLKTGVAKWWSESFEESETFEGKPQEEAVAAVLQHGDAMSDVKQADDGSWSYKITRKGNRPRVMAVAPEDFTVSVDTVSLRNTPYCAHRARRRLFELLAEGYAREKLERFQTYGTAADSEIDRARDTAGEGDDAVAPTGDRRLVEIVEHYVRQESGKYLRVLTDATETILLEQEEVGSCRFAAITPYIVPHRFYGESVADRLIQIQRIRTSLTRMVLDQGNFSLNGRKYINMDKVNEWTISDLLNNQPNMPIRGNGDGAVTEMTAPTMGFDGFQALEYFSTQAEQRTGVVRNAQGLNPDTLHDTAQGAMALMSAAQKRTRLIARVFAETGIKDMFLGLHALIRETASGMQKVRLRNKWVEVDPTSWGSRSDMTIEIGVGASGKEGQALMVMQALQMVERVVTMQGGVDGPFVTRENVYNLLKRAFEKGFDFKSSDPFLSDPKDQPSQEPQPDPAAMEAEAKMALKQAELQGKQMEARAQMELDRERASMELALEREKAEAEAQLEQQRIQAQLEADRERNALQLAHLREKAALEYELAQDKMQWDAELKAVGIASNAREEAVVNGPHDGGDVG